MDKIVFFLLKLHFRAHFFYSHEFDNVRADCTLVVRFSSSIVDAFVDQSTPFPVKNTSRRRLTHHTTSVGRRRSANGGGMSRCSCGSCFWWTCEKQRKRRNFRERYRMFQKLIVCLCNCELPYVTKKIQI